MREIEPEPPSKVKDSKGTGSYIRRSGIDIRNTGWLQVWLPGNIGGLAIHCNSSGDSLRLN